MLALTISRHRTSAKGVSHAVRCAAQTKTPIAARSGGHSYAAYSIAPTAESGALVVDLANFQNVILDPTTGHVVSGTGNTIGSLALGIYDQGNRALPHGVCPYVRRV